MSSSTWSIFWAHLSTVYREGEKEKETGSCGEWTDRLNSKQNSERRKPNLSELHLITAFFQTQAFAPAQSCTLPFSHGKSCFRYPAFSRQPGEGRQCLTKRPSSKSQIEMLGFSYLVLLAAISSPPLKMCIAKSAQTNQGYKDCFIFLNRKDSSTYSPPLAKVTY